MPLHGGGLGLMVPKTASTSVLVPAGYNAGSGFLDLEARNLTLTGLAIITGTVTSASQFLAPNGSAAAPTYTFTNFATTGLYAAAGPLMGVTVGTTATGLWTAGRLDLGFGVLSLGMTLGAPETDIRRGFSGSILFAVAGSLTSYRDIMAKSMGATQMTSDSPPQSVLYTSQSAYPGATGANTTGAASVFAAGIGRWLLTVANFAALAGATITVTTRGTAGPSTVILTEGVNWTAAVSNAATATSIGAALVATSIFNLVVGATVGIQMTEGYDYQQTVTTSDLVNLTVAQGTNGTAILACNTSTVTLATLTLTSTVPVLAPDGTAALPGFGYASDPDTGFYRILSGIVEFTANGSREIQFAPGNIVIINNSAQLLYGSIADLGTGRLAAASLRQGLAPSATPVAQTFTLGEASRPATDNNVGGSSGTIRSGLGTGTGAVSTLIFQTPTVAASGTGAQSYATRLTLSSASAVFGVSVVLVGGTAVTDVGVSRRTLTGDNVLCLYSQLGDSSDSVSICGGPYIGVQNAGALPSDYFRSHMFNNGFRTNANGVFSFSGSSTSLADAADTAFMRNAAGVAEVTNGTANVYRDIKVRNILIDNNGTPGGLQFSAAQANGAAAQVGTLTNAPAAGNPTKWIPINDAGTTRYVPAW